MAPDFLKTIIATTITSSGIIGIVTGIILKNVKKRLDDNAAIKLGVQALLRHELYDMHERYCVQLGYAPVAAKEDFENMYNQYHILGANGVMDSIREEIKRLPTQLTAKE